MCLNPSSRQLKLLEQKQIHPPFRPRYDHVTHSFFKTIEWELLEQKQIPPPTGLGMISDHVSKPFYKTIEWELLEQKQFPHPYRPRMIM
jgi:hypothetical protein